MRWKMAPPWLPLVWMTTTRRKWKTCTLPWLTVSAKKRLKSKLDGARNGPAYRGKTTVAKISELLLARLKALGMDVVAVERVYRNQYGAAAGQWAWSAQLADGSEVGSEDTMTACVRAATLKYHRPPYPAASIQIHAVS